jgi:hypothetical protein
MLPPPITMPTLTPRRWISRSSEAIPLTIALSMPKDCEPIRASPESLRRMRR